MNKPPGVRRVGIHTDYFKDIVEDSYVPLNNQFFVFVHAHVVSRSTPSALIGGGRLDHSPATTSRSWSCWPSVPARLRGAQRQFYSCPREACDLEGTRLPARPMVKSQNS